MGNKNEKGNETSLHFVDIGGDIHIDNDEDFKKETDLMWVATHQIGHSLGLMHSGLQSAIMWPWNARKIGADIDLTQDDIMGIQSLYGKYSLKTISRPMGCCINASRNSVYCSTSKNQYK